MNDQIMKDRLAEAKARLDTQNTLAGLSEEEMSDLLEALDLRPRQRAALALWHCRLRYFAYI